MAVKIRLKRMGKIRAPFYRVVVMDSRTKRDGRAIEEIGKYHPTAEPSVIEIDSDRAQHWLSTGAQPTEAVAALLKVTGDWQKFKGLPGAEGTLKVAEAEEGQEGAVRGRDRRGRWQQPRRQGHADAQVRPRQVRREEGGREARREGCGDQACGDRAREDG